VREGRGGGGARSLACCGLPGCVASAWVAEPSALKCFWVFPSIAQVTRSTVPREPGSAAARTGLLGQVLPLAERLLYAGEPVEISPYLSATASLLVSALVAGVLRVVQKAGEHAKKGPPGRGAPPGGAQGYVSEAIIEVGPEDSWLWAGRRAPTPDSDENNGYWNVGDGGVPHVKPSWYFQRNVNIQKEFMTRASAAIE